MQGYVCLNNCFIVFNQSYPILECQCNPDGSTTLECNDNGDCSCKDGYIGQKCDDSGKILKYRIHLFFKDKSFNALKLAFEQFFDEFQL